MLDMLFEVASTLFMATLAGLFIWFVLSDGNQLNISSGGSTATNLAFATGAYS